MALLKREIELLIDLVKKKLEAIIVFDRDDQIARNSLVCSLEFLKAAVDNPSKVAMIDKTWDVEVLIDLVNNKIASAEVDEDPRIVSCLNHCLSELKAMMLTATKSVVVNKRGRKPKVPRL